MKSNSRVRGTVLITGATSGIGLELAKLFAAQQYYIVAVGRDKEKLKRIKDQIKKVVKTIAIDISHPDAPQKLHDEIKKDAIDIDILVNNAGFGVYGSFSETDIKKEINMIEVNALAPTRLTKLFLDDILQRGRGKILNVASTAAFEPGPLMAVYFATKAYVLSLSEALAHELKGSGITVTALCPGATKTNFSKSADMETSRLFQYSVMDARTVARIAYNGLMREKKVVIPGIMNKLLVFSLRFMPRSVIPKVVSVLMERT